MHSLFCRVAYRFGFFGWYLVGISRFLPHRYRRKTRLVPFGTVSGREPLFSLISRVRYRIKLGFLTTPAFYGVLRRKYTKKITGRVNSYTAHFSDSRTMAAAGLLCTHWPGGSQTKLGLASLHYGRCVLQVALTNSVTCVFRSTS